MAGVEGEADVLDERRRAGRRPAVDARVGEGEMADLHRWRHRAWPPAVAGGGAVERWCVLVGGEEGRRVAARRVV